MASKSQKIVYGLHAVKSALTSLDAEQSQSFQQSTLLIENNHISPRIEQIKKIARAKHIRWQFVSKIELNKLTNASHQGVVFVFQSDEQALTPIYDEKWLQQLLDKQESVFLLLLDGVQDPHNLGACLRTANAVNVDALVIPKDNAVGMTPVVMKVAAGAAQSTPLVQVTNFARMLERLKHSRVWVYGAAGEAKQTVFQCHFDKRSAIVLGAEGKGLRQLTRKKCDEMLSIPMYGEVESLNVSVAAGLLLYAAKQSMQE